MKKLIIIPLILLVYFCHAQDSASFKATDYKNILKFGPLNFLDYTMQISYERTFKENNGLLFSAGIKYKDANNYYEEAVQAIKAEFQYRYYVINKSGKNTYKRIYLGSFLFAKYSEVDDQCWDWYWGGHYDKTTYYFNSYGLGVITGVNFIFAKRLHMDLYIGGGLRKSFCSNDVTDYYFNSTNRSIWKEGYNGIVPKAGFDIGLNF